VVGATQGVIIFIDTIADVSTGFIYTCYAN